ncbi:hypothetical protein Y032_0006g2978 [Ancylostoma ceylanicum]|uniref:Uncharacterized protein n=1 Tax=Ancylostoma ceylanicum TaxID=53326 RepID=A0A016VQY5_9BILA|nr:hypothetical protein Y032_0006g2978 [Ancylostoma ceylanicum]
MSPQVNLFVVNILPDMPNSTPMGMDHRHLAIWMWTHSQSLTDNSETSIESAASDGYSAATEITVFAHVSRPQRIC